MPIFLEQARYESKITQLHAGEEISRLDVRMEWNQLPADCVHNYYSRVTTSVIIMYADDTQVYLELSQSDTHKSISSLSDCLTDISLWMKSSKLLKAKFR